MKIELDLLNSLLPFIVGFVCGGVFVSGYMLFVNYLENKKENK